MRHLVLLVAATACCLHASSFTSATCTLGTTTIAQTGTANSSCIFNADNGEPILNADADASNSFSGTQATLGVFTGADVIGSAIPPILMPSAASQASNDQIFTTTGPTRTGSIQFTVDLLYAHEDFTGASTAILDDGVHQYTFLGGGGIHGPIAPVNCGPESCEYTGTLPFDLGSTFEISVFSHSEVALNGGPSAGSTITFSLLDAGSAVPLFFLPEPKSDSLAVLGIGSLWALNLRRRRSLSRH